MIKRDSERLDNLPAEAGLQEDGEVTKLVWNLMKENGSRRCHTQLEAGEEGGADCQAVEKVVSAVGQQVEITDNLLVPRLPHLGVALGVAQLQHLLQQEEGEDPTQYGGSNPTVAVLLLVIKHLKHKHVAAPSLVQLVHLVLHTC